MTFRVKVLMWIPFICMCVYSYTTGDFMGSYLWLLVVWGIIATLFSDECGDIWRP